MATQNAKQRQAKQKHNAQKTKNKKHGPHQTQVLGEGK